MEELSLSIKHHKIKKLNANFSRENVCMCFAALMTSHLNVFSRFTSHHKMSANTTWCHWQCHFVFLTFIELLNWCQLTSVQSYVVTLGANANFPIEDALQFTSLLSQFRTYNILKINILKGLIGEYFNAIILSCITSQNYHYLNIRSIGNIKIYSQNTLVFQSVSFMLDIEQNVLSDPVRLGQVICHIYQSLPQPRLQTTYIFKKFQVFFNQ